MRVQRISPPEKPCVCAQSGDGFTSASSPTRSLTLGRWDCGERTIQSLSWQRFQLVNQRQYKGLRYAGYGVAVNHDADSHISPAPELMEFHLKTREAPLFAAVNTPEKQPDHLFRSLGFNRTWDEWRREEDARTHATERRHDRGWSQ